MFSTEQMDYLTKHFDDRYRKMFVEIDDCNEKQKENSQKFANDDKRIDLIIQNQQHGDRKITLNNWLTTAILSVIITLAFKLFFGG